MLQVSDSLFPIGSFTLSNGLETFVQEHVLKNRKDLQEYINNVIFLMPYTELGFFAQIFKARYDEQGKISQDALTNLDALYSAHKSPMEVRKGSQKLCQRFLKVWEHIEELPNLILYKELIKKGNCLGHHVFAFALFAKSKGIDFKYAASVYAYSTISGIITNAVKSVPLSQLDGQKILSHSLQNIESMVEKAIEIQWDELGIGGAGFDIYAMRHEELYSRLYMS